MNAQIAEKGSVLPPIDYNKIRSELAEIQGVANQYPFTLTWEDMVNGKEGWTSEQNDQFFHQRTVMEAPRRRIAQLKDIVLSDRFYDRVDYQTQFAQAAFLEFLAPYINRETVQGFNLFTDFTKEGGFPEQTLRPLVFEKQLQNSFDTLLSPEIPRRFERLNNQPITLENLKENLPIELNVQKFTTDELNKFFESQGRQKNERRAELISRLSSERVKRAFYRWQQDQLAMQIGGLSQKEVSHYRERENKEELCLQDVYKMMTDRALFVIKTDFDKNLEAQNNLKLIKEGNKRRLERSTERSEVVTQLQEVERLVYLSEDFEILSASKDRQLRYFTLVDIAIAALRNYYSASDTQKLFPKNRAPNNNSMLDAIGRVAYRLSQDENWQKIVKKNDLKSFGAYSTSPYGWLQRLSEGIESLIQLS